MIRALLRAAVAGIKMISNRIAQQIKNDHCHKNGDPRPDNDPWLRLKHTSPAAHHIAQFRGGGHRAQSKEA